MYVEESTIDDILNSVYKYLLEKGERVVSSKGPHIEIQGAFIKLLNPIARLSITQTRGIAISPIGELLWYLSGSNDLEFIKYYLSKYGDLSDDEKTLYGAYGPRLFSMHGGINQIFEVIKLLKRKKTTRKAVVQLYDAHDLINSKSKDIPCTCTIQFLIRNNKLSMFTYMRSNDVYIGLCHDIFCFTMIQEIMANILKLELGHYNHFVSSLHLYENKIDMARQYLNEGFQSNKLIMPEMPSDKIIRNIKNVLNFEKEIRLNNEISLNIDLLPSYWKDIVLLLKIYSIKNEKGEEIFKLINQITNITLKTMMEEKYKL